MVPNSSEAVKIQQRELARQAEVVRVRREAKRHNQPASRSYAEAVRFVDEARVAAHRGLIGEAKKLLARAHGLV